MGFSPFIGMPCQGSGGQLLPLTTTSTAMAEPSNVCKLPLCQLHAKTAPQLFILERPFRCGDGTCGNKRGHHVDTFFFGAEAM